MARDDFRALFFQRVPNLVQLCQSNVAEFFSPLAQFVFDSIEPSDKFIRRLLQRNFRIEPALASEINDGEKQVADLIGGRGLVSRFDRLLRFRQFFINLRDDVGQLVPVKIHPGRLFLRLLRPHQGRQRGGKVGQIVAALRAILVLVLDGFPLFHHAFRIAHVTLRENVRMSPDQLRRHFLQDFVDMETPGFVRNFRMHHGEQNQVAQLFAKIGVVLRANRARHFIRFLDDRRQQRFVRLLGVPRATAGSAELRDDGAQFCECGVAQIFHSERCVRNSETSPVVFLPT